MLEHKNQIKTYTVGVIAPRTFNDVTLLHDVFADKLAQLSHIVTNNVVAGGETVQNYARNIGIPFSVFPITAQAGGVLMSNAKIINQSDFIVIFHDGESKNTLNAKVECEKRAKKYRIIDFTPLPSRQNDIDKCKTLIQERMGELLQSGENHTEMKFLNKLLKILE